MGEAKRGISPTTIQQEGFGIEEWLLEVVGWSPFYRQLARCIASIPSVELRASFMEETIGIDGRGDEGNEYFLQKNVNIASLSDRAIGNMAQALAMINDDLGRQAVDNS